MLIPLKIFFRGNTELFGLLCIYMGYTIIRSDRSVSDHAIQVKDNNAIDQVS